MSFKVDPSSYFGFKFMSYYFGTSAQSITATSYMNHNLRGPESEREILNEQTVQKEPFIYPIPKDQEIQAEVDPFVLKKDSVLNKLKTCGQNYK